MKREKIMENNYKKKSGVLLLSSVFSKKSLLGLTVTAFISLPVMAQEPVQNTVSVTKEVSQGAISANIPLALSRDLTNDPSMFHVEDSNKIVVDFFNSQSLLKQKPEVFDNPLIASITTKEVGDRTRLIIETKQPVKFGFSKENQQITLNFSTAPKYENVAVSNTLKAQGVVVASVTPTIVQTVASDTVAVPTKVQLDQINFKKDKGKIGKLTLDFSDSLTNPIITRSGNSLIIELKGVAISPEMQKTISATKLGVATQSIDVSTQNGNGRIVLQQKDGWDFSVYQLNKKLTVEVKSLSEYDAYVKSQEGKDAYRGKPLSINFQNMDVRTILQVIADFSHLNILTSDQVTGSMTVRLQEVPWDQALDLILEAKNLQKVKNGNVIWVATRGEVTEKNKAQIELQNQAADLEPLKLEMFQLNHHKAKDVKDILEGSNAGSSGGAGNSKDAPTLLSKRGTVGYDERNNILLVQDIPSRIEEVRKLLKRIDISTRQVLIESKIVVADDKFDRELGAKFGVNASHTSGNTTINIGNPLGTSTSGTNVNFSSPAPTGAGAIGLSILNLASGAALNVELSALETNNRGKVLSSPRLLTTDNKKAVLEQGTEIPYVTPGSANAPPTVTFKKAVLSLGVTPQISPNGKIIMDLQIRKDTVGELVNVQGGGQVPSIDTRNIDTEVTVNNGQTVVLGGVYEITNTTDASKVPFLGDIPFLGNLFKSTSKIQQKAELLIFITPYVVDDEDLDAVSNNEKEEEIDLKRTEK